MNKANDFSTLNEEDVLSIRNDFPIFSEYDKNENLKYFDNAATTYKPLCVIDAMKDFDSSKYATVRRGIYEKSVIATRDYENVRKKIANFIKADNPKEIIFTSGTTQSINLVAYSFSKAFLSEGDEIIISEMEHHANIVPWQVIALEKKLKLKVIPINDDGEIILDEYIKLLSPKTKLVCITHISNVLGTINPIEKITKLAHNIGAKVLIDGAQAIAHTKVNVKKLNCDFYVFSAHKIYGPNGVGILYGKYDLLDKMPPYICGGEMINSVSFDKTTYAGLPAKFEGGTPPITQVIGFGVAIDYISSIGLEKIASYEKKLLDKLKHLLSNYLGLNIIGKAKEKSSIISFHLDYAHAHDIVSIFDYCKIAVRGGHHCAQPLMKRFKLSATTRISLSFYNTLEELDSIINALDEVKKVFS